MCWLVILVLGVIVAGFIGCLAVKGWTVWGERPAGPPEDAKRDKSPVQEAQNVVEVKLPAEAAERTGIRVESVAKHILRPSFRVPARVSFNEEAMAQDRNSGARSRGGSQVQAGDVVRRDHVLLLVESPQLGEAEGDYLQKLTALAAARASVEPVRSAFQRQISE